MDIHSIVWMVILLAFSGVGLILNKFKDGLFWLMLAVGLILAVIAATDLL